MLFNILCFYAGLFLLGLNLGSLQLCGGNARFVSVLSVSVPEFLQRCRHLRWHHGCHICDCATVPQQYHGCPICLCKNWEEAERKNTPEHQVSSNTMEPQQIAQRTGKMQRGQGETFQSTRCTNSLNWMAQDTQRGMSVQESGRCRGRGENI